MELRTDIVTLAVPDLEVANRYYVEGLGWEPAFAMPGEVTFLRSGSGRMIAPFARSDLATDIGDGGSVPISSMPWSLIETRPRLRSVSEVRRWISPRSPRSRRRSAS